MKPPLASLPDSLDDLVATLAATAGFEDEELLPDDNLFELGLDSVHLTRLIGQWRTAGVTASLADFLGRPTPEQWWEILRESGVLGGN